MNKWLKRFLGLDIPNELPSVPLDINGFFTIELQGETHPAIRIIISEAVFLIASHKKGRNWEQDNLRICSELLLDHDHDRIENCKLYVNDVLAMDADYDHEFRDKNSIISRINEFHEGQWCDDVKEIANVIESNKQRKIAIDYETRFAPLENDEEM